MCIKRRKGGPGSRIGSSEPVKERHEDDRVGMCRSSKRFDSLIMEVNSVKLGKGTPDCWLAR